MSENRQPQPRDRVHVEFDAEYHGTAGEGFPHRVVVMKDGGHPALISLPDDATVRVLEPADDPSKDDVGTLRREDHHDQNPPGVSLWQCIHRPAYGTLWLCVHSTAKGNLEAVLDHGDVVGMPVIGVVPGTPAAEAQETDEPPPGLYGLFQTLPEGYESWDEYHASHQPGPRPTAKPSPPLSEYSQHLAHRASPVDGCEYCPPPGQVRP